MSTTCLAVIPSRFPSTRLEGKPLKDIAGKLLVQRVWEQATKAKSLTEVVVATDDPRIQAAVQAFGGRVLMTSSAARTGSDRVAEALAILEREGKRFDLVANVQGDMPFINPVVIDRTVQALAEGPSFGMSTVANPILREEEFLKNSTVKVVLGVDGLVLYFSRAPIPYSREPLTGAINEQNPYGYKHSGLYVFRPEVLKRFASLEQSLPEEREKLEQLRALCNGIRIRVAVVTPQEIWPSIEIDTPDDLAAAQAIAPTFEQLVRTAV
jgi:3-deoxy-manno-octulosonate cytidylyltransferase (CMP-KDO synthetase)